jgi:nucleoid-associated protein YgaU
VTHRFSPAGLGTVCLALVVGSALLFVPLAGAQAADKRSTTAEARNAAGEIATFKSSQAKSEAAKAKRVEAEKAKAKQAASKTDKARVDKSKADKSKTDKSRLARSEPETTGSLGDPAAAEPVCDKSRKRLWVEGEGWVVRRVTTCALTQN